MTSRPILASRAARATLLGSALIIALLVVIAPTRAVTNARAGAPQAPPGFFGVNASNLGPDDFEMMDEAGVGALRAVFPFAAAKTRRNQPYSWGGFDWLVNETAESGLDVTPVLYGVPPWISTERSAVPLHGREAVVEWRRYLEALVRRYGPGGTYWASNPYVPYHPIDTWQVWNEPNSITWWAPRPRPREYGLLLRRSADALHSVDPSASVMSAGIVAHPTNEHAIPGNAYVRGLLAAPGVAAATDILAFHPYAPTVRAVHNQLISVRKVLRKSGAGGIPIWVTEIGWGTKGPIDHPLIKSKRGQVRSLRDLFETTLRLSERLGVERLFWYHWRDAPDDLCLWCESSGLLDRRSRPKPIYDAFRHIAAP